MQPRYGQQASGSTSKVPFARLLAWLVFLRVHTASRNVPSTEADKQDRLF